MIDGKYRVVHDEPIKQSWFSSVLQAIHNRVATAERVAKDYAKRAKHWLDVQSRKLALKGINKFRNYMNKIHSHKRIAHTEHNKLTYQQFVDKNNKFSDIWSKSNKVMNR